MKITLKKLYHICCSSAILVEASASAGSVKRLRLPGASSDGLRHGKVPYRARCSDKHAAVLRLQGRSLRTGVFIRPFQESLPCRRPSGRGTRADGAVHAVGLSARGSPPGRELEAGRYEAQGIAEP